MFKLGGITFDAFSSPEFWPLGGEQKIAIKELPGGSVIYQPRGYFQTKDHSWEGTFEGENAERDARKIDEMVKSGKSVEVSFGNIKIYVFVEVFRWSWVRDKYIDFSISVKRDLSRPKPKSTTDPVKKAVEKVASKSKATSKPATKTTTYVVKQGDTLRGIARKYYNNASKFESIFNDNKKVIGSNPNKIKPGQKLVIKL